MEEKENFIHNKYGYCYYIVESNDTAIIYNLYIEPIYRKQGHAKHLIQLIIQEIRKLGYDGEIQIEAQPREDNIDIKYLIDFYKKMELKVI